MLGDNLRHCRELSHLTPKDLASYLGVSVQAISKWENDACEPSIENLKALSKLYGIRIDDLVGVKKPALLVSKKKWTLNLLVLLLLLVLGFAIEVGKNHYSIVVGSKQEMHSWSEQYDMAEVIDVYNEKLIDEQLSGYVVYGNEYYAIYDKNSKLTRIGVAEEHSREQYCVFASFQKVNSNGYRSGFDMFSVYFTTINGKKYIIVGDNDQQTKQALDLASLSEIRAVNAYE